MPLLGKLQYPECLTLTLPSYLKSSFYNVTYLKIENYQNQYMPKSVGTQKQSLKTLMEHSNTEHLSI